MKIRNWRHYQHYKERNPPWIKLHFELLSSVDWVTLDDASRVLAIAAMLVASRNGGSIPDDPAYIQRLAYLNSPPNFEPLIRCGFIELDGGASTMLADASTLHPNARPETETETEEEEEKEPPIVPQGGAPEIEYPYEAILQDLNERAGTSFRPTSEATRKLIRARLNEGHTPADFFTVHAKKVHDWTGTEQAQFIRPSTLYRPKHFEEYLNGAASRRPITPGHVSQEFIDGGSPI